MENRLRQRSCLPVHRLGRGPKCIGQLRANVVDTIATAHRIAGGKDEEKGEGGAAIKRQTGCATSTHSFPAHAR